jgi:hypothetical protein
MFFFLLLGIRLKKEEVRISSFSFSVIDRRHLPSISAPYKFTFLNGTVSREFEDNIPFAE